MKIANRSNSELATMLFKQRDNLSHILQDINSMIKENVDMPEVGDTVYISANEYLEYYPLVVTDLLDDLGTIIAVEESIKRTHTLRRDNYYLNMLSK